MARGKHSTSSEARRARESAEQEVVRLRRENERLNRLVETERAEAEEAIGLLAAKVEVLRADAENGTSEKLDVALDDIDELKDRLAAQPGEILQAIKGEVLSMKLPISSWTRISSAFGMKYGDFLQVGHEGEPPSSRRVRRMTARQANLNVAIQSDKSFIGE